MAHLPLDLLATFETSRTSPLSQYQTPKHLLNLVCFVDAYTMENTSESTQHLRLDSPSNSPSEETKQTKSTKALIQCYLRQHLAVYRELCEVREAVSIR
jgi:hypothetical protein